MGEVNCIADNGICPLAAGECVDTCFLAECKPDGKPDEMDIARDERIRRDELAEFAELVLRVMAAGRVA